jgi:hypothetical protein
MTGNNTWHVGNAAMDGAPRRGWVVGHFRDPDDIRLSKDVEIKWGVHPAGEERAAWQGDEKRTTIILLVNGRFRINLSVGSHLLTNQGDYAMWGPGVGHSRHAEEDSSSSLSAGPPFVSEFPDC